MRFGCRNCYVAAVHGSAPYCMNQPWLTTIDCPVSALDSKPARNATVLATSATS